MDKNRKPPYLGAAYYPELWDISCVDRDIQLMKETGCNIARIGEFAWGTMEPKEGEYDLSFFRKVVDKLAEENIAVIMCTPSATPPQWLTDKYEETRIMYPSGMRQVHGARRHTCPNSPVMRGFNRKIVTKMAEEFGKDKSIVGWQIDNELHLTNCHCPICRKKFRKWLEEKYQTVENLNKSWGMDRWSLSYDSFDKIIPPDAGWNHPSLSSAWDRFTSDSFVEFSDEQAEILHKYTDAPVGTDMMPYADFSYYDTMKKLDIVQFNHYDDESGMYKITFWLDYIRAIKDRPYWVTETQIGWNGSFNSTKCRPINFCYANSWLSYAAGGEANMYWLWRAHPNGHELGHGAVITSSGRKTFKTKEVERLGEEIQKAADFLNNTAVKLEVALHYSYVASNIFKYAPIADDFKYLDSLKDFYLSLAHNNHINMDVIDHPHNVDGYKYIFSPFLCTLDKYSLRERMIEWVKNGGTWIVGPLSDIVDEHTTKYTDAPFGILEEICGIYCDEQMPSANLPQDMTWYDGSAASGGICYDAFHIVNIVGKIGANSAKPLIIYADGPFKGLCAATETKYGGGRIILLGTALKSDGISKLVSYLKLDAMKASENVYVVNRAGETDSPDRQQGIIALELRGKDGYLELDGEYSDVISSEKLSGKIELAAYTVKVLKKI
ncbi:MAG: beta-galactosidase [Oscillospiraceae bacterium]|nr:beta-galactosidase [Oscillospiraceae bacterium]